MTDRFDYDEGDVPELTADELALCAGPVEPSDPELMAAYFGPPRPSTLDLLAALEESFANAKAARQPQAVPTYPGTDRAIELGHVVLAQRRHGQLALPSCGTVVDIARNLIQLKGDPGEDGGTTWYVDANRLAGQIEFLHESQEAADEALYAEHPDARPLTITATMTYGAWVDVLSLLDEVPELTTSSYHTATAVALYDVLAEAMAAAQEVKP